jgi:hypothetical protein
VKLLSSTFAFVLFGGLGAHAADRAVPAVAPSLTSDWSLQATVNLINLQRRGSGADVPIAPGLSSRDFDLGRSTGADARIAAAFRGFGVEGRYLGSFEWHDQRKTGLVTAIFTTPNINFGARPVTADYVSDLRSYEFNGFWQIVPRARVFAGYRRFDIEESFQFSSAAAPILAWPRTTGFQATRGESRSGCSRERTCRR